MPEAGSIQGYPRAELPSRLGRWWIRKRRWRRIPDQPIVHLLPDSDPDRLITELANHLHSVVPNTPLNVSASLPGTEQAAAGQDQEELERMLSRQLRERLNLAARKFLEHPSAKRIGRLRFPRYALLSWLLNQNIQPSELANSPNPQSRQLLKDYFGPRRRQQQPDQAEAAAWSAAEQQVPWYLFTFVVLVYPLYYAWRMRFGRVARWFMSQRYLSPGDSEDFPAFAQRLIMTPSKRENAEQVRKLLVHAFLADLADAYARGLRWRWIPKDSYPVLLLRGLDPGTIGETLVRLVNDVRNETIIRDPLLIVGSGTQQLLDEPAPEGGTLEQWPEHLQAARRRRSPTAWYRPVRVTDTDAGAGDSLPPIVRVLPLQHSQAWRRVPSTAVIVALLAAGGVYVKQFLGPCGELMPVHRLFGSDTEVWTEGEECVGISDGGFIFVPKVPFSDDGETKKLQAQLQELQSAIVKLNHDIAEDHERDKSRPYVTVVYFGTLSAPNPNSSTLNGVLEEIRGIKHAQHTAWRDGRVLMEVLFANGGDEMKHAEEVAERLGALAERRADSEAPVVGVIGLGGSWDTTKRAITKLGEAGLPSIGTVTSADELVTATPLYHQVAPNNRRQADIVKQYLDQHHQDVSDIKVFHAEDDLYSKNLAEDLKDELAAQLEPSDVTSDNISCGEQNLLFFAGRADRLGEFLNEVTSTCKSRNQQLPLLMAGDDVNKYMLDRELPADVTLEYTSFYGHTNPPVELSGRGALANDAIVVLRHAVTNVTDDPNPVQLSGLSVWHSIESRPKPVPGITGDISYPKVSPQAPENKAISILRMDGRGSEPSVVWLCDPGCRAPGP